MDIKNKSKNSKTKYVKFNCANEKSIKNFFINYMRKNKCPNVFINASIHGLSNRKTSEMFESIAAFADIGQFIEHPVRTYSSGMRMRLAFAIQIHMKPDILIVDEALSVGDDFFRQRCYNRINGLLTSVITFLFVTHNEEILRHLASRALLLHEGMLIQDSNPKQTIDAYKLLLGDKRRKSVQDRILRHKKTSKAQNPQEAKTKAHASICNVVIQSADGMPCNYFHPGHPMKIVLKGTCQTSVENLSVGIRIRNKEGLKIYSWATANQDEHTVSEGGSNPLFREKARGVSGFEVEFSFNCHLGKNLYYVEAYLANEDIQIRQNKQILDWVSEAAFFRVHFEDNGYFFGGVSDLKMNASWHMGTEESDPK